MSKPAGDPQKPADCGKSSPVDAVPSEVGRLAEHWRAAVRELKDLKHAEETPKIELLAAALESFDALDQAISADPDRTHRDAFEYENLRDGMVDMELLDRILFYGAPVGEMSFALPSLGEDPEAPWLLLPGLPVALTSSLVVTIGVEPNLTDLVAYLQSVVDPVTVDRARLDVASFYVEQLRTGVRDGTQAWLVAMEKRPPLLHRAAPQPETSKGWR